MPNLKTDMSKRSAVMIAYDFPPEGNAGAYRPLRFVRHLSRLGWKLSVISCTPPCYERYDPNLLSQVPGEVHVRRISFYDPWQALQANRTRQAKDLLSKYTSEGAEQIHQSHQGVCRSFLRNVVRKVEAWSYHPDLAMPWISPGVEATVEACVGIQASVIWATAGPVSSFLVGQRASQLAGVPYVLDFRDAWTISHNDFEALRPRWARERDRRNMFRLLAAAQAVVFPYESVAQCFWAAYRGALRSERVHIIPNGFEGPIEESTIPTGSDRCEILYTGTLSSYHYGSFLKSIQRLKELDAACASKLRIRFVGESMDALAQEVAALGLSAIVQTSGPVTQADVLKLQRDAHALLIFGRPREMQGHELFAGAKLFSYLRSGRPVLGVLPHDETRKILERAGVSTIANADSIPEITEVVKRLIDAFCAGTIASLVPRRSACLAYSAEQQIDALIRALEGRPAVEPFTPGVASVPESLREVIGEGGWVKVSPNSRFVPSLG
jgi:hypothetical protein